MNIAAVDLPYAQRKARALQIQFGRVKIAGNLLFGIIFACKRKRTEVKLDQIGRIELQLQFGFQWIAHVSLRIAVTSA